MFNLKKFRLVAGVSVLTLALVACGGGENAPANNTAAPANNAAATENAAGAKDVAELGDIAVISREDGSGTRGAFTEITGLLEKDASGNEIDNTSEDADIQNSTNGVMTTVAGNEAAIGYISLGSLNDTVKPLKVEGVEPTAETIISGEYKIARPFLLVTKGEAAEGSIEADFLKFAASKAGQDIVEAEGYVKVAGEEEYTPANLEGTITVAGSTSVTPVMEKLAEEYSKLNPNAKIEIQSNGSSAGITAATDGTAQIGMSSRELKDEEKAAGLSEFVLAKDGIAVIVNTVNPTEDITMDQVKTVFNGEITAWADLAK